MSNLRRSDGLRSAPNYVTANVVMFGVNLIWILFSIWAVFGFFYVVLAGLLLNHAITMLEERLMSNAHSPHPEGPE